jgi:beta-glucanase (GH16 family)
MCAFTPILVNAQISPVSELNTDKWKLVMNEEFDQGYIDPDVWLVSDDTTSDGSHNTNIHFDTEGQTGNELARFSTIRQTGNSYSTAHIKSTAKYLYGAFEIRCKMPVGEGIMSAFWLYDDRGKENVFCPRQGGWVEKKIDWQEIDIFEQNGVRKDRWKTSIHWDHLAACHEDEAEAKQFDIDHDNNNVASNCSEVNEDWYGIPASSDLSAGFHIFTCLWYANEIQFYVDGVNFWNYHPLLPYRIPDSNLNIIVNSGIGNGTTPYDCDESESYFIGPNSNSPNQTEFYVDYVRAYKLTPACVDVQECVYSYNYEQDDSYHLANSFNLGGNVACNYSIDHYSTPGVWDIAWHPEIKPNFNNTTFSGYGQLPNYHLLAKDYIRLRDGFTVKKGISFSAVLDDEACGSSGNKLAGNSQPNSPDRGSTIAEEKELLIIPNPNNGLFTLKLSGIEIPYTIEVMNLMGQTIYSQHQTQSTNHVIDIKEQPSGIYFVKVTSEGQTITKRFILT